LCTHTNSSSGTVFGDPTVGLRRGHQLLAGLAGDQDRQETYPDGRRRLEEVSGGVDGGGDGLAGEDALVGVGEVVDQIVVAGVVCGVG